MLSTYESLNIEQEVSERDLFTEERYRQFYRFLAKDTKTVLDIGCNTGRGGSVLNQLNSSLDISGLDCVESRLERLPKDAYTRSICGLSTDIPCEDYSFDAVVAGEFIEHLYAMDVEKTLAEIFRVLKIGGRLLLTTPNPEDIKKRIRGESVLGSAHLSQHFSNTLSLKLRTLGYANVRILGSGKVSRYLGTHFPLLNIYGSYLCLADKI